MIDSDFRVFNPRFVKMVHAKRRTPTIQHAISVPANISGTAESAHGIIKEWANGSGFTVDDIIGNRLFRKLTDFRSEVMADVYVRCPHLSETRIGEIFRKDKTCIYKAAKLHGVHVTQTGQERAHKCHNPKLLAA